MTTTSWKAIVLAATVAILVLAVACLSNRGLSDFTAQEILNEKWGDQYHFLLLGNAKVVADSDDIANRRISESEFQWVLAWAQVGLVDLEVQDVNVDNFGRGERFMELVFDRVLKLIEVTPTEDGRALQASSELKIPLESKFLYARFNRTSVDEIVENQELKKDTDLFRVVKGTASTTWSAEGEKIYAARGEAMPQQRRFVALFKFDPFDNAWKLFTHDVSDGDGKFSSDYVGAALGN